MAAERMRILQIAHSHPKFHPGGTELVALALHEEALKRGIDSWFLGALDSSQTLPNAGTGMIALSPDHRESALFVSRFNRFRLEQSGRAFLSEFRFYLESVRPDVVHVHHVLNFGLEAFHVARQTLPQAKILLTLHDYYLICANRGQLYRHDTRSRCEGPSLHDCPKCLPDRGGGDFALRALDIAHTVGTCDVLVSPSNFLRGIMERHLRPEKPIEIVENGYVGSDDPLPPRHRTEGGDVVFGYFGNIVAIKGLEDLLDAAEILVARGRRGFRVHVHGAQLIPDEALKARMERAEATLGTLIRFAGGYRTHETASLMTDVDCVVFPSVWWENAPLVIYEALHHRRQVIAYPHGGAPEILHRHGAGLIADASRPEALAREMERVLDDPALATARSTRAVPRRAELFDAYRSLYRP